jgi:hypothetical protein
MIPGECLLADERGLANIDAKMLRSGLLDVAYEARYQGQIGVRMKFQQQSARNAQEQPRLSSGNPPMLKRSRPLPRIALLTSLILLVSPAGSFASDPLLSGYGGPGSGEQVVLGGSSVGGAPPASPSASGTAAGAPQSLKAAGAAPTPASGKTTTGTLTRKPQRTPSPSKHTTSVGSSSKGSSTAPVIGAPAVVAYPTRAGAVGRLPISMAGILLLVLTGGALALTGLGLRHLASRSGRRPDPQVSVR